jgi:hypothetical protein
VTFGWKQDDLKWAQACHDKSSAMINNDHAGSPAFRVFDQGQNPTIPEVRPP